MANITISKQVNCYIDFSEKFIADLTESKSNNIQCLISCQNISDISNNPQFWTPIPTRTIGVNKYYHIEALYNYIKYYNFINVPDPTRNFSNIDFMIPRICYNYQLYLKLNDQNSNLNQFNIDISAIINTDIATNRLSDIINHWKQNSYTENLIQNSLPYGINIWKKCNLVFTQSPEDILRHLSKEQRCPGAFFIRRSSKDQYNQNGQATIFTVTYITKNNNVNHIRCLSVHCVGIYLLTTQSRNQDFTYLCNKPSMQTMLIKDLLHDIIGSIQPQYVSLIQLLEYFHLRKVINLRYIITP